MTFTKGRSNSKIPARPNQCKMATKSPNQLLLGVSSQYHIQNTWLVYSHSFNQMDTDIYKRILHLAYLHVVKNGMLEMLTKVVKMLPLFSIPSLGLSKVVITGMPLMMKPIGGGICLVLQTFRSVLGIFIKSSMSSNVKEPYNILYQLLKAEVWGFL